MDETTEADKRKKPINPWLGDPTLDASVRYFSSPPPLDDFLLGDDGIICYLIQSGMITVNELVCELNLDKKKVFGMLGITAVTEKKSQHLKIDSKMALEIIKDHSNQVISHRIWPEEYIINDRRNSIMSYYVDENRLQKLKETFINTSSIKPGELKRGESYYLLEYLTDLIVRGELNQDKKSQAQEWLLEILKSKDRLVRLDAWSFVPDFLKYNIITEENDVNQLKEVISDLLKINSRDSSFDETIVIRALYIIPIIIKRGIMEMEELYPLDWLFTLLKNYNESIRGEAWRIVPFLIEVRLITVEIIKKLKEWFFAVLRYTSDHHFREKTGMDGAFQYRFHSASSKALDTLPYFLESGFITEENDVNQLKEIISDLLKSRDRNTRLKTWYSLRYLIEIGLTTPPKISSEKKWLFDLVKTSYFYKNDLDE